MSAIEGGDGNDDRQRNEIGDSYAVNYHRAMRSLAGEGGLQEAITASGHTDSSQHSDWAKR
jgi:hypothetical protein